MGSEIHRKILLHEVEVAETNDQPGDKREQRNQKDEGNKEAAQSVSEGLNGRLSREESNRSKLSLVQVRNAATHHLGHLSLLHQSNDLRQRGVLPHVCCLHQQSSVSVSGARHHQTANLLPDRQWLPYRQGQRQL